MEFNILRLYGVMGSFLTLICIYCFRRFFASNSAKKGLALYMTFSLTSVLLSLFTRGNAYWATLYVSLFILTITLLVVFYDKVKS
ncbi:MAG: hypothetical protein BM556_11425 [Bacteriovorax sp. MedPE-SWde]|nr:MAG: hypothetical protein BM556_11425 [Bacteriovorax sp. MedPE-SWde]